MDDFDLGRFCVCMTSRVQGSVLDCVEQRSFVGDNDVWKFFKQKYGIRFAPEADLLN